VLRVVAAAVVRDHGLLLVSKTAAPDVFYLPGGKPDDGETDLACLARELAEELSVEPDDPRFLAEVEETAALEGVPMRMRVYLAGLHGDPRAGAEIAHVRWYRSGEPFADRLAPAVERHVVPLLQARGL
jgi:8-oxo-dGTP diphosphatase